MSDTNRRVRQMMTPTSSSMVDKKDELVRAGQFDRALSIFYDEVGQRSGELLKQYHAMMAEPLALRVAYLEMPWPQRWWLDLKVEWAYLRVWWMADDKTQSAPEPDASPRPEPDTEGAGGGAGPAPVLPRGVHGEV